MFRSFQGVIGISCLPEDGHSHSETLEPRNPHVIELSRQESDLVSNLSSGKWILLWSSEVSCRPRKQNYLSTTVWRLGFSNSLMSGLIVAEFSWIQSCQEMTANLAQYRLLSISREVEMYVLLGFTYEFQSREKPYLKKSNMSEEWC